MTLINVAVGAKLVEIKNMLEKHEDPSYHFVKMLSVAEMQFEVDDDNPDHDLLHLTKVLIRSMPFGRVIAFRVLYDGQIFEGGPIYKPGDYEYQVAHHMKAIKPKK